jgi:hypothetical protein
MAHRVFVVGEDNRIMKLFFERPEFRITRFLTTANVVVFPGGPDVNPALYGHAKHPSTSCDDIRDKAFSAVYNLRKNRDILKIGICGGGQFLHVTNGGFMYQDVNKHALATSHLLEYSPYEKPVPGASTHYQVTSTHHQMMSDPKIGSDGEIWGWAKESTFKDIGQSQHFVCSEHTLDNEIIWYPKTSSLCFQPHPEYGHKQTEDVFWKAVFTAIQRNAINPKNTA